MSRSRKRFRGWSSKVVRAFMGPAFGPIAQRLEQGTHNPLVPGSNPGGPKEILDLRFANAALLRRALRGLRSVVSCVLFSALILIPRCANYEDVFIDGKIYFVDADCYARMTRVRMVAEHPGLIVRQHDFENFPAGTIPHTTAPFDYLIVVLSWALVALTAQPLDLAGAMVSPLLALAGGWFLWWWSRRLAGPGRYAALLLYALSGILVHGTALGRPDHQSLLIVALLVALAAEWTLQENPSRRWSVVSGLSWGLALWVSLYEPLILLGGLVLCAATDRWSKLAAPPRRVGWFVCLGVVALAALLERRWPEWPGAQPFFVSWSGTIGELKPVGLTTRTWFDWCGGLILLSPFLLAVARRRRTLPLTFAGLLVLTFLLTLWEARWGYFLAVVFVLTLPVQIAVVRQKWLAWGALAFVLLPLLQFWDGQFWPNDQMATRRAQDRIDAVQWRAAASRLGDLLARRSSRRGGFRLRSPTGRASQRLRAALTKVFPASPRARVSLSPPRRKKRRRFCAGTKCSGFSSPRATAWPKIRLRSSGSPHQRGRFVVCSTVPPQKRLHF